jgi:hypothetical protein
LCLHKRWHIQSFLRNDSYADVYAVFDNDVQRLRCQIEDDVEAHCFLDEYHNNWKTAASRKRKRLLSGGNGEYLDDFRYGNRCVVIVRVPKKAERFEVSAKDMKKKFPVLVADWMQLAQVHFHNKKLTYAEVARKAELGTSTDTRKEEARANKSVLQEKAKKREKQRLKRQEQRSARRACSSIQEHAA